MSNTNTYIAPPNCENCGTEKTLTYICCKCIEKLNAKRTDYADLEAERDEWKRRCEKMVAMAAPGTKPCNCIDEHGPDENCEYCEERDHYGDSCEWYGQYATHARILAIAEGRDNG